MRGGQRQPVRPILGNEDDITLHSSKEQRKTVLLPVRITMPRWAYGTGHHVHEKSGEKAPSKRQSMQAWSRKALRQLSDGSIVSR